MMKTSTKISLLGSVVILAIGSITFYLSRQLSKIEVDFDDVFDGGWFHEWASPKERGE